MEKQQESARTRAAEAYPANVQHYTVEGYGLQEKHIFVRTVKSLVGAVQSYTGWSHLRTRKRLIGQRMLYRYPVEMRMQRVTHDPDQYGLCSAIDV
jgi:hypothetical protein